MPMRKNFIDLTPDERTRLAAALNALEANGTIAAFAGEHAAEFNRGIHWGSAFLPWHRHFLIRLEQRLQAIDPSLTIPYWAWTRADSRSLEVEPWRSFFGGRANSGGQFDHWSYTRTTPEPPADGTLPDLRRRVGSGAVVLEELQRATYREFRTMETGSHFPGHNWTGGTMAGGTSPADPIFYFHHCNVDRLWAIWQRNHPEADQYSSDRMDPNDDRVGVTGAHPGLDEAMNGGATPRSMLDHTALGYRYPRDPEMEAAWAAEGLGTIVTGDPAPDEPADRSGPALLMPAATALLAHKRLSDVVDGLERRIRTSRVAANVGGFRSTVVKPQSVERQVLTLARAARDMYRGGPSTPTNPAVRLRGAGSFALLGSLGLELPALASVFAPGGDWVAEAIRRGTPDPHRSLVALPSAEFAREVGRRALSKTSDASEQARIRGATMGMLAATGSAIVTGPQLRDLFSKATNRDWDRWSASGGAAGAEQLIRSRIFGGAPESELVTWWPPVGAVPSAFWDGYIEALGSVHGLPDGRRAGFADLAEPSGYLDADRLRNGYAVLRDNLGTSSWPVMAWWGIVSPMVLAPSISMLIGLGLDHFKKFFTPGATLDERAFFELLTLSMGIGSVAPIVYSMILWGLVDDFNDPFINAIVLAVLRAVLVPVGLATDPGPLGRWLGFYPALLSMDVYGLVRSIVAGARDLPGPSFVFGLQTLPTITSAVTLIFSALAKWAIDGREDGAYFWLVWGIATALMLGALGFGLAVPLSNGGGYWSWFMRADRRVSLAAALRAVASRPVDPRAVAAVFDETTLWADPQTGSGDGMEHMAYPTGMRGLVKVWWSGSNDLEIRHDAAQVVLRPAGAAEVPIALPQAGETPVELASLIDAALPDVHAAAVGPGDPQYRLPWPTTLADPGDAGPLADHGAARDRFIRVSTDEDEPTILRHAPRIEHTTRRGLAPSGSGAAVAFPVVPGATLGDLEETGLGLAADLAVILAMASVPALSGGSVTVSDGITPPLPPDRARVGEVAEVFRRWNLDERRRNEWDMLVSGGARSEKRGDASVADPLMATRSAAHPAPAGEPIATAMGWIPIWRAWLRMATDPAADTSSSLAMPYTPVVQFADGSRRPTNEELSAGVSYLLELR
ncbi:MAG TPA: tyrosinase family protein [Acidimicrobiia bacterium]